MRTLRNAILLSLLCAMVAAQQAPTTPAGQAAPAQSWKQVKIPPLPAFHPQMPKRIELPNGMIIFLQEDHELPLIDGVMRIRGGSREEPANKVGMLDIYGDAWRTGGTTQRTGDQLDDFLEAHAASVETGGGVDSTVISFSALKQDFEPVFAIFLELLQQPAFRQDKIDLAKDQAFTGISRRNDDVSSIAGREARKLAYGARHPYARQEEFATVAAVTREDLLAWHKRTVHPNNMIIGIVGDFDAAQMEARLRQAFEKWPRGPETPKPQFDFKDPKAGVYFVEKPDVNQTTIRMVHLGITRRNPDYFAVEVMNEVLGGGFSGRLMTNIRTKKGLAYSVGGGVGAGWEYPGIFTLGMGTKSGTTAEAIQALFDELQDLVKSPPTEDEVSRAKDSILNSFVFNFDSPEKVLREQMAYEFYGFPADFLEQYRAGIERVTPDDVERVAQKYIDAKKLAILVVGKSSEFDKPLSTFGPVTPIDITIPMPPGMGSQQPQ